MVFYLLSFFLSRSLSVNLFLYFSFFSQNSLTYIFTRTCQVLCLFGLPIGLLGLLLLMEDSQPWPHEQHFPKIIRKNIKPKTQSLLLQYWSPLCLLSVIFMNIVELFILFMLSRPSFTSEWADIVFMTYNLQELL